MKTPCILTVFVALAAPALAREAVSGGVPGREAAGYTWLERAGQDREPQERERIERERAREQAERDRDRAREQAERDRDRAREQAERDRARQRGRQDGIEETERTTRTVRIGANGELLLANVAGDITITRGGGSEAAVEIVKTARGRTSEEAREMLGLVTVDVIERGPRAEVKTRYPPGDEMRRTNRRNLHVMVNYNVTVPAGTRVRANSISGSVSAKDIKGDVALKSVSGTVRIVNGGGLTEAESISGNIEVGETELSSLSASSASGNVMLRRVKARQLELNSISGSVVLDDVECPRVEAQTVSGDVKFGGPLPKNSRYEFSSHSGSVTVAIGGSGFEVEATSFSGSVRSDFPLGGDAERVRRGPGRSLRGVVGDGSAVLELTTFSGNIVITKR